MGANDLTLEQLLADPLTRLVMASDRVEESDLRSLLKRSFSARVEDPAASRASRPSGGRELCPSL
jgi:hypothetical protein